MSFYFITNVTKQLINKGHLNLKTVSLQHESSTATKDSYLKTFIFVSPSNIKSFVFDINKVKRTFLFTSVSGSLTVEAAILFPIILFLLAAILHFFTIIFLQLELQIRLDEVAREINEYAYISQLMEQYGQEEFDTSNLQNDFFLTVLNSTAVKEKFEDIPLIAQVEKLNFYNTRIYSDDDIYDLIITYETRFPFIPEDIYTAKLMVRRRFKAFTGKELESNIELAEQYVYKTSESDTFHRDKYCSYLERYSYAINYNTLLQNYPYVEGCDFCKNTLENIGLSIVPNTTTVYVTAEYEVYHTTIKCPVLMRNLIRLPYEEASENFNPCHRCVVSSR